jgi:hypothetical protein
VERARPNLSSIRLIRGKEKLYVGIVKNAIAQFGRHTIKSIGSPARIGCGYTE